jgi:hypothetical protein
VDDGHGPLAVRAEGQAGGGIEGRAVDAAPDGQGRDHPPAHGVDDGHEVVAANREEPPVLPIEGQAGRLLAGLERPAALDLEAPGVQGHDLALVLDVHVDAALVVRHRELRLAAQGNGTGHRAARRVEGGGIAAPAVEREHPARGAVVQDRVRVLTGLDLADPAQGLEVEDRRARAATVADEAAAKVAGDRDAVHARRVRDVADHRPGIGVDHHHVRAVRNEQTARGRVEGEIVPAAVAAELDRADQPVAGRCGGSRGESHRHAGRHRDRRHVEHRSLPRWGRIRCGM